MKKILTWVGIVIAGLIGLLVVAVVLVFVVSNSRTNNTYDIQMEGVAVSADAETIERGRHLAVTRGCVDCHGEDFGGAVLLEDPAIGVIYAPNLTKGQGGLVDFEDVDYVRAIRHGLD